MLPWQHGLHELEELSQPLQLCLHVLQLQAGLRTVLGVVELFLKLLVGGLHLPQLLGDFLDGGLHNGVHLVGRCGGLGHLGLGDERAGGGGGGGRVVSVAWWRRAVWVRLRARLLLLHDLCDRVRQRVLHILQLHLEALDLRAQRVEHLAGLRVRHCRRRLASLGIFRHRLPHLLQLLLHGVHTFPQRLHILDGRADCSLARLPCRSFHRSRR
mmetsp:Transcript_64709/g.166511  ORF Transcript_64709/g.166511 Transcript_64709/m.166511 type:complete len:213 (+) Transcript_64709:1123-1761(+)